MIWIVSKEEDLHASAVLAELERRSAPAQVLDLAAYPRVSSASLRFGGGTRCEAPWNGRWTGHGEPELDLSEVGSVWWRRPQAFELDPSLSDPGHRAFAYGECEELWGGLWSILDAFWINDPKRDERAHKKPFPMRVAQEVGLELPDTLMTNSVEEARRFIAHHGLGQVVYKSFSATLEHWRETRILREEEAVDLGSVRLCPLIFQEFVPAACDLRVTVVQGRVFAAAIYGDDRSYPVDFRMNMDHVRIEPHDLPRDIEQKLVVLLGRLGLVYGAVDFRLTPDGRYVFLEVNPAGQWLFVEDATGLGITEAMASTLAAADRDRCDSGEVTGLTRPEKWPIMTG